MVIEGNDEKQACDGRVSTEVYTQTRYTGTCRVCGAKHVDNTYAAALAKAQACEAQGKDESAFKFYIGEVVSFRVRSVDSTQEGRIVATEFKKKTHEPMYVLQETSHNSLYYCTEHTVSVDAYKLQRVPDIKKLRTLFIYMCLRCKEEFSSENEHEAQKYAEQCENQCRENKLRKK